MSSRPTTSSAAFSASAPPSPSYRVLWRLLTSAPDRLHLQWISVRAPSEAAAIATVLGYRPEWDVLRVEREKNP